MRRFYDPNIDLSASSHTLSEEESKHIIRVLRLKNGDNIELVNGHGALITAVISDDHPKRCTVDFENIEQQDQPAYDIHIAVCPTKQLERIEWFVEKATEIGITEISFIETENMERTRLKIDRIVKKAVSAMKQSKRLFLPKINEIQKLSPFLSEHPNGLIAHCIDGEKNTIESVFNPKGCPILIGPEGDFSQKEIDFALENGYKTITLGENRLRTETAALYACMRTQWILEK